MRRALLAALTLTASLLVATSCGGTHKHALSNSSCRPESMGAPLRCSRTPPAAARPTVPAGQTGIDLSNNDPSFGSWGTIRRHASFAYFKVSEGTGFIDRTAARMAREARAHGLFVGGYDFQHVCGDDPVREAQVFITAARADGLLTGHGVLPPTADFEAGSGCNASAWLAAWSRTVRRLTPDSVYSDPGFYVPSVGCFHQADYGWVADLGGFQPLCGLRTVMHQYSFTAWDGVASVDGDVFLGSYHQLAELAHAATPPPKPTPPAPRPGPGQLQKRILELRADLQRHHCRTIHGPHAFRLCRRWAREGRQAHREAHQLTHT